MQRVGAFACLGLVVALAATAGAAAASVEKVIGSISVPKISAAPPIDGTLADPAWKNAVQVTLPYDLRTHSHDAESTTWYLMTDGEFLYVAVDARQSETIRATEHTNMVGLDTDDEVQVDLWPNGSRGFGYKFTSTPIGTHYEYSTENNAFEPTWWSVGKIDPGGYIINMKIPIGVMHGTGAGGWRVQLIRYVETTNTPYVWSYGSEQGSFNDVKYSGTLSGLPMLAGLHEPPRVGVYALGALAANSIGGSTSRVGADVSIPIVSGTAFVSTFHPDYSDVEIDQQTISPTAFQRYYQDVRPFFTQGANFDSYPDGTCVQCPGISELYTPNIPTPREGYEVEGQRGLFDYDGFDAIGDSRDDVSEAINYDAPNLENSIDFQGTASDQPGLHDDADGLVLTHDNTTDLKEFVRYASNSGTGVLAGDQAQRYEAGWVYYTPTSQLSFVDRKIGEYFDPIDALVDHPDIAGWAASYTDSIPFSQTAAITSVNLNADLDRYHDHTGELDQTDNYAQLSATTRTLFTTGVSTGSDYVLFPAADFAPSPSSAEFLPTGQNGIFIGYNQDGSTPTQVNLDTGHFGQGLLDSWLRSTTMKFGEKGLLSLEVDDTQQFADTGSTYTQWLERASFALQQNADDSVALGVRRIIGVAPDLTGVNSFEDGWNVSAAFRRKFPNGELYLVYGDAALFSTSPQFIIKYVRYFGADKGT
jgi:hypothetical protein